jgi:hypothetical protein
MDNLTFTEQQRAKEKNYSQVRKKKLRRSFNSLKDGGVQEHQFKRKGQGSSH